MKFVLHDTQRDEHLHIEAFIADPGVNGIGANGRSLGYYALTATGDVGIGNPFLGGGGPRGVQFAAKVTF